MSACERRATNEIAYGRVGRRRSATAATRQNETMEESIYTTECKLQGRYATRNETLDCNSRWPCPIISLVMSVRTKKQWTHTECRHMDGDVLKQLRNNLELGPDPRPVSVENWHRAHHGASPQVGKSRGNASVVWISYGYSARLHTIGLVASGPAHQLPLWLCTVVSNHTGTEI